MFRARTTPNLQYTALCLFVPLIPRAWLRSKVKDGGLSRGLTGADSEYTFAQKLSKESQWLIGINSNEIKRKKSTMTLCTRVTCWRWAVAFVSNSYFGRNGCGCWLMTICLFAYDSVPATTYGDYNERTCITWSSPASVVSECVTERDLRDRFSFVFLFLCVYSIRVPSRTYTPTTSNKHGDWSNQPQQRQVSRMSCHFRSFSSCRHGLTPRDMAFFLLWDFYSRCRRILLRSISGFLFR